MKLLIFSLLILTAACGSLDENIYESYLHNDDYTAHESGLIYRIVEEGDGESPQKGDLVTISYTGKLASGRIFDESENFTRPIGTGRFIKGLDSGIMLMKTGETREFIFPSGLAYGSRGTNVVPPDATVIFLVKLIKVSR
jgi:FKBP-type peptidyl-prolyl cis-trans isomerase